jgi:hypothetical protein
LAVKHAKSAVESAPAESMTTLGIAYYRAGLYGSDLAALNDSMALNDGGDSLDWIFLAMAHFRLGHRPEAERWYSQAQEWRMEKNRIGDPDLRRYRDEADALFATGEPLTPSPTPQKTGARGAKVRILLPSPRCGEKGWG